MKCSTTFSRLLLYDGMALLSVIACLGATDKLPIVYLHVAGGMLLFILGLVTAQFAFNVPAIWKGLLLSRIFAGCWFALIFTIYRLSVEFEIANPIR